MDLLRSVCATYTCCLMASLRSAEVAELAPAPVADLPVNELRSIMCVCVCRRWFGSKMWRRRDGSVPHQQSQSDERILEHPRLCHADLLLRSSTFGDVGQKLIFRSRRRNVPVRRLCVCKRCTAKPHFLLARCPHLCPISAELSRAVVDPLTARRLCNPPSSTIQPTQERQPTR